MTEEEQIKQALADLEGDDKQKQEAALRTLVYFMRHPLIWLKMTPMLESDDANIRFLAAGALGRSGDASVVPYLLEAIRDESADVRQAIAAALGKLGAQNALPDLVQMLRDPSADVRREAVSSLMKLGNFMAAQAVASCLADSDETVRDLAARAYALLAPLADIHSSDSHRQQQGLSKLVGQQHPVILNEVLPFLRHEDVELRRLCADVLASYESPKALPALLEAIQDEDLYIRGMAAEGLGKLGDPVAVPALELLSRHELPVLRGIAVDALGRIGDPTCVPPLIARLEDTGVYGAEPHLKSIAAAAAEALHKIGTREAMSALNSRKITVPGSALTSPTDKEVR